jgi:hypothetical protein
VGDVGETVAVAKTAAAQEDEAVASK